MIKIRLCILLMICSLAPSANATHWYVDALLGNNTFDGLSKTVGGGTKGPKKTIGAAITAASSSDTISVSEGIYEELLVVDKALKIWGSNFGIDASSSSRKAESIITCPRPILGISISGNSIIEILSCCVQIDGFTITGDNPNLNSLSSKYGKEYEASYAIAGNGSYTDIGLSNLIVRNFEKTGIYFSSVKFPSKNNQFTKCKIQYGNKGSKAISLKNSFYANIASISIDSVESGLVLDSFSLKNSQTYTLQNLNINVEAIGMGFSNFTGNTDVINISNNQISNRNPAAPLTAISCNNLASIGTLNFTSNALSNVSRGVYITNWNSNFNLSFSNTSIVKGLNGYIIDQSSSMPAKSLTINTMSISNMRYDAFDAKSLGGLLNITTNNLSIYKGEIGMKIIGNCNLTPNNTQFDSILNYYIFLDSSNGLKPTSKIDATQCSFDGTLGNNLSGKKAFRVEDMIRHNLDRPNLAWVLFKNNALYVTANDDNQFLMRAMKLASSNWNIYLDSSKSNEIVTVTQTVHLYTHRSAQIGYFSMANNSATLYLHGRLYCSGGLELKGGLVELTPLDTFIVQRSLSGTLLSKGGNQSYVNGTLFLRYTNFPINHIINDTLPIGIANEFRPMHISASWPSGITHFECGFRLFYGTAPFNSIPSDISHISDVRYWQLINPFNQKAFDIDKVGLSFSTGSNNDLVNDPLNLRLVFDDGTQGYNLGGTASSANAGIITSTMGNPGFGLYTFGNHINGNNLISAKAVVAKLTIDGKCVNDSIILSAVNSRSLSNITDYKWRIAGPTAIFSSENQVSIKKVLPVAGLYKITLIVTNSLGVSDTVKTSFDVYPTPQVKYDIYLPCYPLPILLTNKTSTPVGTGIIKTEWKINAFNYSNDNISYTPDSAGLQKGYLKITLNTGCFDSVLINEISPAEPKITLTPNGSLSICDGDSVEVKIKKTPGLLIWNDGKNYDSLNIKQNSFYRATLYANKDCYRRDSVAVKVLPVPTVNAGPDLKVFPGEEVQILGQSNAMVEWTPIIWLNDATIENPKCRPLSSTQYQVRAYNTDGCEAYDTVIVSISNDNYENFPNLLTPNDDGHNDVWVFSNISDPENCTVNIFTREGLNVFSAESYENDFNGTHNGSLLNDGYYVYVIKHKPSGKIYTGLLNILK